MRVIQMDISQILLQLINGKHELQHATDVVVIIVQSPAIDIVGIHIFPSLGHKNTFTSLDAESLFGITYERW